MSPSHKHNVIRKSDLRIGDRPWLKQREDCKQEDLSAAGLDEDELMGRPCVVVEMLPQDSQEVTVWLCFTFSRRQIEDVEYIPTSEQHHYLPIHPETSPANKLLRLKSPSTRRPGYVCASRVYTIPVRLLAPRDARNHARLAPASTVLLLQSIQNLQHDAEAAYQQALARIEQTHSTHLKSHGLAVAMMDRNLLLQDMQHNCSSCKILIAAACMRLGGHCPGRTQSSNAPVVNLGRMPSTPPLAPRWPSNLAQANPTEPSPRPGVADTEALRITEAPSTPPPAQPALSPGPRAADPVTPRTSQSSSSLPPTPRWPIIGRHRVTLLD